MELSPKLARDLIERLSAVSDPRKSRGRRHKIISVLAISLCAIMSNARGFAAIAEWAERCSQKTLKRLYCRYDPKKQRYIPPSEPTIRRLLQTVDAEAVYQALCGSWIHSDDAISVDGKTVRGARQEDGRQVHILSAFLQNHGAVIAQQQVENPATCSAIPCPLPPIIFLVWREMHATRQGSPRAAEGS